MREYAAHQRRPWTRIARLLQGCCSRLIGHAHCWGPVELPVIWRPHRWAHGTARFRGGMEEPSSKSRMRPGWLDDGDFGYGACEASQSATVRIAGFGGGGGECL